MLCVSKYIPTSLAGESYGGTLTLHVARHFQDNDPEELPTTTTAVAAVTVPQTKVMVDSIILLVPAIIGDIPPSPVYELLVFLAGYFPQWRPFFMPNPVSPHRIWRNETVRTAMVNPNGYHCHIDGSGRPFRLGTGLNLVQALAACRAMLRELTVPFLTLHGTMDYAVPIAGSELLWRLAPSAQSSSAASSTLASSAAPPTPTQLQPQQPPPPSRFCRLDGAYHDLLADPCVTDQCLDEISQWIKGRLTS